MSVELKAIPQNAAQNASTCPIDGIHPPYGVFECRIEKFAGGGWERVTAMLSNGGTKQVFKPEEITPEFIREIFGPGRYRLRWIRHDGGKTRAGGQSTHFDVHAVEQEQPGKPPSITQGKVGATTPPGTGPLEGLAALGIDSPVLQAYLLGYNAGRSEGDRYTHWLSNIAVQQSERDRAFWAQQSAKDREFYQAKTDLQKQYWESSRSDQSAEAMADALADRLEGMLAQANSGGGGGEAVGQQVLGILGKIAAVVEAKYGKSG